MGGKQGKSVQTPGNLEKLIDSELGGKGRAQKALHYLAKGNDPEELRNAAAVIVCGDPFDVSAPIAAVDAVKRSKAPVLLISGAAGPKGTLPLLEMASDWLQNPPVYDPTKKQWRLPLASKFSQTEWVKKDIQNMEDPKEDELMESDIYLELALNELTQKCPDIEPKDVAITVNGLSHDPGKTLRIAVENKSRNSGQNAIMSEALLREYLKGCEHKKVIFVKAPLLLLRGLLTLRNPGPKTLEGAGNLPKEEWLGGVTEVLSYADDCPHLADLGPSQRVALIEQAAGEYKRIRNYNEVHLTVEEDFDERTAETMRQWEKIAEKLRTLPEVQHTPGSEGERTAGRCS